MPNSTSQQEFLARATGKAAESLKEALLRIPEDKRAWSPMGDARTALDMAAECAMMNQATIAMIEKRVFPEDFDWGEYQKQKAELAQSTEAVLALLARTTPAVIEAIRPVPSEDLSIEIPMPWGPMTLSEVVGYPFWNMSYHEGQINYIASMLGCL